MPGLAVPADVIEGLRKLPVEGPVDADEIRRLTGVSIAALGRKRLNFVRPSDDEIRFINYVFEAGVAHLRKVAPSIAADVERQRLLAIVMAGVAKATFPFRKNYAFPSVPGSLGVAWLFPQAIRYAATPGPTAPCYTSYKPNSWDIDVTAGTPAWLFGDGTNFYRASPATERHSFILVFDNGVIEVGSTPSIEQFWMYSEAKMDYGIYTVEPLVDVPVEKGVALYQYPTPLGATFVSHTSGIMWGFMPRTSGTKTIKLLGLVFYEHDFASSLRWVA
ncbi:MAG: hypothetical protein QXU64_02005 [Thermofilaceae archaeon]